MAHVAIGRHVSREPSRGVLQALVEPDGTDAVRGALPVHEANHGVCVGQNRLGNGEGGDGDGDGDRGKGAGEREKTRHDDNGAAGVGRWRRLGV